MLMIEDFFNSIKDNSIDWFTGQTRVNITFSQRKWINKIKKLAEKYPNEVIIQNVCIKTVFESLS